jgi:flagellar FliL protein
MAEADLKQTDVEPPKKTKRGGLVLALLAAVGLAGGGFYASFSGLIFSQQDAEHSATDLPNAEQLPLPAMTFVPIQPLVINVGANGADRFLRFQAQLEVRPEDENDVAALMPRIVDVLNGYLRAVEVSELEKRAALVKLRAQMLRRIQVVTGEGRVRDLLIMEFVLT